MPLVKISYKGGTGAIFITSSLSRSQYMQLKDISCHFNPHTHSLLNNNSCFLSLCPFIRYFLFYYPLLSAIVGVSSNFIFLSVLFILSYLRLLLKVEWRSEQVRGEAHRLALDRSQVVLTGHSIMFLHDCMLT